MNSVDCPHCGERDAAEFASGGPPKRRPDVGDVSPERWRAYLYGRPNPAGWTTESWYHRAGCRRFLVIERNTVTGESRAARPAGGTTT